MRSPSKTVTRQHDQIGLMASAARKNAVEVAEGISSRLAAQQAAAAAPIDWKSVLDQLSEFLLDHGNVLIGRDEELQLSRRLERQLRDRRNQVVKQVRNQLRGARFLLDQAFGKDRVLGAFPARKELSSMDPRNLLRVAKEVVAQLEGSGVEWPPVEVIGHAATPAQLLSGLRQTVAVLEATLGELRPEKQGAQFALGTRQKDLETSVDALQRGADFLFGLFRFGGFDFAAERLRPRRRRTKANEEPSAPLAAPAAGATPAAAVPEAAPVLAAAAA
jgi:hypothetical protein